MVLQLIPGHTAAYTFVALQLIYSHFWFNGNPISDFDFDLGFVNSIKAGQHIIHKRRSKLRLLVNKSDLIIYSYECVKI